MNPALSAPTLALIGFCILAEIGRELAFKRAALAADGAAVYALALAGRPVLWAGLCLWAVEIVAWVVVLQTAPLSLAYPIMTLTYAGVPLAGRLFLREQLSIGQIVGAGLVALGVICVGISGA